MAWSYKREEYGIPHSEFRILNSINGAPIAQLNPPEADWPPEPEVAGLSPAGGASLGLGDRD